MSRYNSTSGGEAAFCILSLIALVLGSSAWQWRAAGMQAEVYRRQGVEMTQWECFMGIKPVERTINIKAPHAAAAEEQGK